LTPLSQNSAVSLTPLSQQRHRYVSKDTAESIKKIFEVLISFKETIKPNPIQLYYPRPLRQKLENWAYLKKFF
jgi:hypothetical protein